MRQRALNRRVPRRLPRASIRPQRGASLIVCLLMLVTVLILGTAAAQISLQEEKASRNDRDRQIALEAAEAALRDAELDIESSPRHHLFSDASSEGFSTQCGGALDSDFAGLCLPAPRGQVPAWRAVDLASRDGRTHAVPYGHYTGRELQSGAGLIPAAPPRYIIELVPYRLTGKSASPEATVRLYRITAMGFGIRGTTRVVLQTYYRKIRGETAWHGLPKGRLSWREIPNWQELHDALETG